ncbi:MAG: DedA family protein [Nitrospiraceae bacterium]|nr:DedA family protein [Nitrospiraceae bacterium]
MHLLTSLLDIFLHLDKHLSLVIQDYGIWTYLILFLIIFCETGLVVTPFLPGDSLLFAAGAFAATGSLELKLLLLLINLAAVLGNAVNYQAGYFAGPKIFQKEDVRLFKREYLERTQHFYEKYGGMTIIIARFLPIIRTFAPFLAGIGRMRYVRFSAYNIVGSLSWASLFIMGGYLFGNIPAVKHNFTMVILAIIVISVLPSVITVLRGRGKARIQGN